jgi:AcrR family transcriptional regulator
MRLSVADRRDQLVEAAITVACRDGIDGGTVRAIVTEAGASVGAVHYCFQDKDELLAEMAFELTRRNASQVLRDLPAHGDLETLLQQAIDALWNVVSRTRGAQLLSYELTTHSLRHAELREVSVNQYVATHAAAREFLLVLAAAADVEWTVPLQTLTRIVATSIDGVVLAWLVDGDDEAAHAQLRLFAEAFATYARPRARSVPAGQQQRPDSGPTKSPRGFRLFVLPATDPARIRQEHQ